MIARVVVLLLFLASPVLAADLIVTGLTDGQTVSGPLRVSAVPSGLTVTGVRFSLKNSARVEVAGNTEGATPYCFIGDPGALPCTPFDTTTVPNGTYTMEIVGGTVTKVLSFTIANGVTPPPPPTRSKTTTIMYDEPTTNSDGTPLRDLALTTIWCQVQGQPEMKCSDMPATSMNGGGHIKTTHVFPNMSTGTRVTYRLTADDTAGNRSVFGAPGVWIAPPDVPGQAGVAVTVITE